MEFNGVVFLGCFPSLNGPPFYGITPREGVEETASSQHI
jgi:hypothetical protein